LPKLRLRLRVTPRPTMAASSPPPLRRVMFVGQPGSGKSTFARMLGKATVRPIVHVVHVLWMDDSIESA
jgi:polynucleotide 5'-kinase involved in rRNA processing